MLKKLLIGITAILSIAFLSGCVAQNDNTIVLSPKIELPKQDLSQFPATISINSVDKRAEQTLAKIMKQDQLIALMPNRDVRFLLQEILEKQMTARGFMTGGQSNVDVQIVLNKLYADVQEGNLRHNITANADISIIATAKNGTQQTKTFRSTYNVEGPLSANNAKVTDTLNFVLTAVITQMSEDTGIATFIRQNGQSSFQ